MFIQKDLAKRLNLKVLRKTKHKLSTFYSSDSDELTHCNVVEIRVHNESIIESVTIPVICQDIAA